MNGRRNAQIGVLQLKDKVRSVQRFWGVFVWNIGLDGGAMGRGTEGGNDHHGALKTDSANF